MSSALSVTHLEPDQDVAAIGHQLPDEYPGRLVNLRALKTAVWRRWRVWLTTGIAGMVLGAGLHLIIPVKYAAKTQVYLTYPVNADPLVSSANDVSLAQTTAVAQQAVDHLHLHVTATAFLSSYTVVADSDAIFTITSSGPSAAAAEARGNAIAQAFLAVRDRERRLQTRLAISGLQAQIRAVQSQLSTLTREINGLPPGAANSATSQLTQLTNQQGADQTQLSQLQGQVQQAQLDLTSVIRGSTIIDPAATTPVSRTKVIATDGITGLVMGIGSAMMILLLGLLLSDRLRTREDVAAVLGAPVELSIAHGMTSKGRRRHLVEPPPALRMIERRLRDRLETAPGTALAVIEVGAPNETALAVAALARSLATQDRRVVVVDMARGRPLASLFGGRKVLAEGRYTLPLGGQHALLIIAPDDPAEAAAQLSVPESAEAVLVLASIDPAYSVDHLAKWATNAVVIVNAKKATASLIGSTGELLRQAGVAIRSAFVIGGDPRDETIGTLGINDLSIATGQMLGERHPAAT